MDKGASDLKKILPAGSAKKQTLMFNAHSASPAEKQIIIN
jgi:hypothetical protein